jgi:ribosomal protein S14
MEDQFELCPKSIRGRIRCKECGVEGYDVDSENSWKKTHLRGHAPCRWCGKQLSLLRNGKPRTHTLCPKRPA